MSESRRFRAIVEARVPRVPMTSVRPEFGPDGELLWLPTPEGTHPPVIACLAGHFPSERQVQEALRECEQEQPGYLRTIERLRDRFGPFLVITSQMTCAFCSAEWARRN